MRKQIFRISAVFSCCTLVILPALGVNPVPGPDWNIPGFSRRINTFTFEQLREHAKTKPLAANAVMSSQSIFGCLAMSYIASGGNTKKELSKVLGFPPNEKQLITNFRALRNQLENDTQNPSIVFEKANSLWLDDSYAEFREEYINKLKENFAASAHRLNLQDTQTASRIINQWITEKTKGKIKIDFTDMLQSRSGSGELNEPALILLNVVFFKAKWACCFNKDDTGEQPFWISVSRSIDLPMMHQYSLLPYSENTNFQFLELPYEGNTFSMYVLLPKKFMSVSEMTSLVSPEMIETLKHSVFFKKVDVLLPTFAFESNFDVSGELKCMGLKAAFDKKTADFDRMIVNLQAYRIYISEVTHGCRIEVNEEGTQATAVSSSTHYSFGCAASIDNMTEIFHADHPFIFLIVHNSSRSILFSGWFSDIQ